MSEYACAWILLVFCGVFWVRRTPSLKINRVELSDGVHNNSFSSVFLQLFPEMKALIALCVLVFVDVVASQCKYTF